MNSKEILKLASQIGCKNAQRGGLKDNRDPSKRPPLLKADAVQKYVLKFIDAGFGRKPPFTKLEPWKNAELMKTFFPKAKFPLS